MTSNLYVDGFLPTFVSDSDSEAIARQSDKYITKDRLVVSSRFLSAFRSLS